MRNFVNSYMPDNDLAIAEKQVDGSIAGMEPYRVSLTNEEKIGLRTLGDGREGYANMVSRACNQHGRHLPKSKEPAELAVAIAYFNSLANFKVKVLHLLEVVEDTTIALGADIMRMADSYIGYLQLARKGDANLDEALKEVDEYNQRFGGRAAEAPVGTVPVVNPIPVVSPVPEK